MTNTNNSDQVVCRFCQRKVRRGQQHHCQPMRERDQSPVTASDDSSFFVSVGVALVTDNWAFGYVAGGHLLGAIIGDALAGDSWAVSDEPPVIDIDPDAGEASAETTPESDIAEDDHDPEVDDSPGESSDSY